MAFQGFGNASGPTTPPTARNPFAHFPRPPSPSPSPPPQTPPRSTIDYGDLAAPPRMPSPPVAFGRGFTAGGSSSFPRVQNEPQLRWGEAKTSSSGSYGPQNYQPRPGHRPPAASNNSTFPREKTAEIHYIQRTNSPYSKSPDKILKDTRIVIESHSDFPSSNRSPVAPYKPRSSSPASQNNLHVGSQHRSDRFPQRFASPVWGHQSELANNNIPASQGGMSSVPPTRGPYQSGQMLQNSHAGAPPPKRTRSPPLSSLSGGSPENAVFPSDGHGRSVVDYRDLDAPETMPSQASAFEGSFLGGGFIRPFAGNEKPFSSSTRNPSKAGHISTAFIQEDISSASTASTSSQSGRSLQPKDADFRVPNLMTPRTPPIRGVSPQNPTSTSDGPKRAPQPQSGRNSSMSIEINGVDVAEDKSMDFPAVKRTKLPFVSSSVPVSREGFDVAPESERESQAKAKRLARFKDELSRPIPSHTMIGSQKVPAKRPHQPAFENQRFSEDQSMDVTDDLMTGGHPDNEGMSTSSSIIGLCPDMCPEAERGERERKGDLDQYERLDGDRNQTSEFLAIKKYNRTAEREAELIRPMPVLQKTMDYLLNLLDQPYDDRFLGLYNFLWDRMRAIRMDLRMQHIFNLEAITMLEQMIRLHIIAMHELCEYTKGEGFSEGFDAHLNIEQMNKTSVELFQLYDDHRKKGMEVPSEREFRGYYALLKLDKHPGYKVEPAELSLDLAKMTPEMRQTHEVLFARDVARACRMGNFIAFFRLARKASYLQACLMHAHFTKLRTQALASLHSGLQINQGIPVSCVAEWLGIEEEDIGDFLEYYGFVVKDFEEPYMVKENAFINVDNDFPVNRSKLVEQKRSGVIVSDVESPSLPGSYAADEAKVVQVNKDPELRPVSLQVTVPANITPARDQEMLDSETAMSPKLKILSPVGNLQEPIHKTSFNLVTPTEEKVGNESQVALSGPLVLDYSNDSAEHRLSRVDSAKKPKYDPIFRNSFGRNVKHDLEPTSPITQGRAKEESTPVMVLDSAANIPIAQPVFAEGLEDEERMSTMQDDNTDEEITDSFDQEIAEAKLKLTLRIWKRRAAKKRELWKQKQLAASAALNSLSLGPPIWQNDVGPAIPLKESGESGVLNIDSVVTERHEIIERSWSILNPSDIVATILADKNPDAKCLCWKMVLCFPEETRCGALQDESPSSAAHSWLLSKLLPTHSDDYADLLVSSPDLAIWKSWIPNQSGDDLTCCLSVIRTTTHEDSDKTMGGASAVLFLLLEHIPIHIQKNRLHDLIMSLHPGSRLPLLILTGSSKVESDPSTIANDLRLHDLDNSRISMFSVTFLKDQKMKNSDGLFSNEHLRTGLEWLANSSPKQIVVHHTKTRELVLSHLSSILDEINIQRIGPNDCVSAFNEAMDRSIEDVSSAAHANPTGWPCPEIEQLQESSDEYRAAVWHLPSTGWSAPARTETLMSALNNSKLPIFENDLSWLSRGVSFSDEIENLKAYLENCLVNYLTDNRLMMGVFLARKEASVMLQKFAQLELHNDTFFIILNWLPIFRRIFNWRLMNLTSVDVSSTYVLEQRGLSFPSSDVLDNSKSEGSTYLPPYIVRPALDELVEVSCIHSDSEPPGDGLASNANTTSLENGNKSLETGILTSYDHPMTEENNGARLMYANKATGEANKLSELLEKCNIMQNMIDKNLSIYF